MSRRTDESPGSCRAPLSRTGPAPELGLLVTLLAEAAAVVALHALGSLPWLAVDWRHPGRWLAGAPVEDALAGVLRLVALTCAWWLLASTLLYLAARLAHRPRMVRAAGWLAVPALRRVVDRALVVALAGGIVSAGGGAWALEPGAGQGGDRACATAPATADRPEVSPEPPLLLCDHGLLLPPGVIPPAPAPPPAPRLRPAPGPPPGRTAPPPARPPAAHVVVSGDTLWDIAADVVARSRGRSAAALSDHEIAPYWSELLAANRGRLRSGDPDLVFPGETIVLPPLGGRP